MKPVYFGEVASREKVRDSARSRGYNFLRGCLMRSSKPKTAAITLYNELLAAIHRHDNLHHICMLYTLYVLACCGGNKSKAATVLDVDRRTVHKWEEKYPDYFHGSIAAQRA